MLSISGNKVLSFSFYSAFDDAIIGVFLFNDRNFVLGLDLCNLSLYLI